MPDQVPVPRAEIDRFIRERGVTVCPPHTFGVGFVPIGWAQQNKLHYAKVSAKQEAARARGCRAARERAAALDGLYRRHFKAGGTIEALATKLGIQARTVRERARNRGLPLPAYTDKPRTPLTPEEGERILSLLGQGHSIRLVAECVGRDDRTVRRVRDAKGVGA